MKKEFKVIVSIILVIWVFIMGFELGILKGTNDIKEALGTTVQTPSMSQSTSESTTVPSTSATTTTPSVSNNPGESSSIPAPGPNGGDVTNLSKEQITAKVVEYVNKVKAEQNMTAKREENITVQLTTCSVPSLTSTINGFVQNLVKPSNHTFVFANGTATDPDGNAITAHDAIPPSNAAHKDAKLDAAGVAEAKVEKQGENTVYIVKLVAESSTKENPAPTHNAGIIGYLDLGGIGDLPLGGEITKADMQYPNSVVEVHVNAQDKVVKLVNKMPMTGKGEAKVGLKASAEFEGALDETWTFTY